MHPEAGSDPAPLVDLRGLSKAFPGVQALADGSIQLRAGEIHALIGENGAGKSTLVKIMTGAERADRGEIRFAGSHVHFASPLDARRAGIATIHQEFTLVPALSVRANCFLGRETTRRGFIDTARESSGARAALGRLGLTLDPETPVSDLSVSEQQLVEIARALLVDARVLILDEPTAALAPREVAALFGILRDLAAAGIAILFIGHRLDEVLAIADRVTVMRDGRTVATHDRAALDRRRLIEEMVGRRVEEEFPGPAGPPGEVRFDVRSLSGGKIRDLSFTVRQGEILGIAGLMGAGRTETLRLLFGADPRARGEIQLDGRTLAIRSPRDAIAHGIAFLTEDRKTEGLLLKASVKDNFALPNLDAWSRFGWIRETLERSRFMARVRALAIRISGENQRAAELSGGNQQKLLVARWLETNAHVILFDEPTRGIDVGARFEMYALIRELAAEGKSIVLVSSEIPELIGLCDRILVLRDGRQSGLIADAPRATPEDVMALAV